MTDLGTDIGLSLSTFDADALFSTVSGVALVRQDAAIRLLTDPTSILPQLDDAGQPIEYDAFDVRTLVGMSLAAAQRKLPAISRAFAADDRIAQPKVAITDDGARPLASLSIACSGMTADGPFRLIFLLSAQPSADDAIRIMQG